MLIHIFVKNLFNGIFFAKALIVLLPVGRGKQMGTTGFLQAGMQY
jgi:hypothetical protein